MIEGCIKITSQSGIANQTEIQMLIFQRGNSYPLLANINDSNSKKSINEGASVQLCSKTKSFNKIEVFHSDPLIGFRFLAITESQEKGACLDLFNFIPVVQKP